MTAQLIVVGTGLKTVGQMTVEAIAWIKAADSVPYVVGDPVAEAMIAELNPAGAFSLQSLYSDSRPRIETYAAMVEHIMSELRAGKRVCAVFYGHPGVFVYPSHAAIAQARTEGFDAVMLPGVSAEDCLFADIGIDPAEHGCLSLEATDFLFHLRPVDPSASLVLWQIGILGNEGYQPGGRYERPLMPLLVAKLDAVFGPGHQGCVYEAAVNPGLAPRLDWAPLAALTRMDLTAASTLFVPPSAAAVPDAAMVAWAQALGVG